MAEGKLKRGQSPYFSTALLFYLIGLITTMVVMHTFNAAQPALLYLSPAAILSVLLTALLRGEVGAMLNFTTEPVKGQSAEYCDEDDEDDEDDGEEIVEKISRAGTAETVPLAKQRAKKD